jgi:hypothetical protein
MPIPLFRQSNQEIKPRRGAAKGVSKGGSAVTIKTQDCMPPVKLVFDGQTTFSGDYLPDGTVIGKVRGWMPLFSSTARPEYGPDQESLGEQQRKHCSAENPNRQNKE